MRVIAVAAIVAAISAALLATGAIAPARAAPEGTIKVGDFFFRPSVKSVTKGTRVKFEWVGSSRHHVVKSKGPGGAIASPATARRGVNLAKRFQKTGTYRFICTIHPTEMRLKLVVK
jgi:plastocyanin